MRQGGRGVRGLDILVNNAGMGDIKPIEETTLAEWDRTVAIDQTGVFLGMKVAAPASEEVRARLGHQHQLDLRHERRIRRLSRLPRRQGSGPHADQERRVHWATEGVRVNSIHPGFIATPILEQSRNTPIWDGMTALTPMARLGRPEDIAAGVAYLASDDAAFVTGLELYIDGGYMAR